MNIYLPIAEISINIFLLMSIGVIVGILSAMLGIGGGFILTPSLIFLGIPSAIVVGSQASMITSSSMVAVISYYERKNIDIKMALILSGGGILGVILGIYIFNLLIAIGQIDFVIRVIFAFFLLLIGFIMIFESLNRFRRKVKGMVKQKRKHSHHWLHGLPLKVKFRPSRLYISCMLPFFIGFIGGVMNSVMGVGGAFIIVPALVYIVGMPTMLAIGTSLLQIIILTTQTTILQAWINNTVDIILSIFLIIGGIIGAKIGSYLVTKVNISLLRTFMACLLILTGAVIAINFLITPNQIYDVLLK